MNFYLQNIVEDISNESLPAKWQGHDFTRFSQNKTLFDFQKRGLQNALKGLWFYFKDKGADKRAVFSHYQDNGFAENFDYSLKNQKGRNAARYFSQYEGSYPVVDAKISFAHFINRMGFWMATGSGKTLIIVKLIELLGKLTAEGELPQRDILFLAHRDDLLEQFKRHVDEFNGFNFDTRINLKSLRDYENVKRENALPFAKNEITVFYYRSDLIAEAQKDKIVNFRNYDNNGQWYILLDEAHKGDRGESKRQALYSILSRNGFLFNFSATFTDARDFATCAFNFNLSKFVEGGYGKHIYVSSSENRAFRGQDDFSNAAKQKAVLKALLLLTYIGKHHEKIKKIDADLYHRPLLLTLVNSVSVEDSDLQLFFKELEKIARNKIKANLIEAAKDELAREFRAHPTFEFEGEAVKINADMIAKLKYEDILRHILNAKTPGSIEVLKMPGNKNELVFRLMTTQKPFALIKIGDISGWLKEKLAGYEINERFENESYFRRINEDDSDINILMGSRSFYEGWDSNRPNALLFVNIGMGDNAKKFVLQSIGRGIRIEPKRHHRRRLVNLLNEQAIEQSLFRKAQNLILPLESLFVYGTNANNLKEIVSALQAEKPGRSLGDAFMVNPQAQKHPLLVPVYKTARNIFAEEETPQKYPISREDFSETARLYAFLGDRVALAKYDCEVKVLQKAKESFDKQDKHYDFSESRSLSEPELILGRVFNYLSVKSKELERFKQLDDEIVHFKQVAFSGGENGDEKREELKQKIRDARHHPERERALKGQYGKVPQEQYDKESKVLEDAGRFELKNQKVSIRYLANHYYIPVIVSEAERIDYLNHIINVESEARFIKELTEYLARADNAFGEFDWWMFSKLDHTLDDILIPYYNPKGNSIAAFKPDFIFWAQKGRQYRIVFVDPKGTEHTDGYRKIDGYSKIFETGAPEKSRDFSHNGFTINAKLLLKPRRGVASVSEKYRKYWFDNFDDFAEKIR